MNSFFDTDFEKAYPTPTSERIAKAYFNRIWRKLHIEHFSFLIVFYGLHRVGKSLSAVSFAYILDPTFEDNLEDRVVYTSKDLMVAFKKIRQLKIKGAAVIIDEAGTGDLSSQRWYEDMAKIVSANLQSIGYLNPFIGFVTQNFSFINSTARKLSNGVFEVSRKSNRFSTIKPFWIHNNPWMSGYYRKYPIFCENRNGIPSNVYKINRIKICMPPHEIRNRYNDHSQAYKDKFLHDSEEDIQLMEQAKNQKNILVSGIDAISEEVYQNQQKYRGFKKNKNTGAINETLIRHEHGLTIRDSRLVKLLVEKKVASDKHGEKSE